MLQWYASSNDFSKRLIAVEANSKFGPPLDLKSLVGRAKQEFGVRRVLCWHAMGGYW